MSEFQSMELPIPLINYIYLIRNRTSPYYDIAQYIWEEMETHYRIVGQGCSETVCTINPRILHEKIEKKIKNEKLTTVNVCRTLLALLYGSSLRQDEDFYITTTSGGRKNYHIRVNPRTLSSLGRFF